MDHLKEMLYPVPTGSCFSQRGGVAVSEIKQMRQHLEALERARDFMLTKIDAGTTHYINHNTVRRLDTIIQDLMAEVDMSEEEA